MMMMMERKASSFQGNILPLMPATDPHRAAETGAIGKGPIRGQRLPFTFDARSASKWSKALISRA
jgi:hypothetical protein